MTDEAVANDAGADDHAARSGRDAVGRFEHPPIVAEALRRGMGEVGETPKRSGGGELGR